jgi:uncharacterized membrane protein
MDKVFTKEKFILYFFYTYLSSIFLSTAGLTLHINLLNTYLFYTVLPTFLLFILIILHSCFTLSLYRSILLAAISSVTGFLFEAYALKNGFFGVEYIYKQTSMVLYEVPYLIIIYWTLIIYIGYSVTNSFLSWKNKAKPSKLSHNYFYLLNVIVLDGLVVTSMDLLIDPVQVTLDNWKWAPPGMYFGVPLWNFVAWFIIVLIITGIFRSYEYFYPQQGKVLSSKVLIIPIIIYFAFLCFYFSVAANLKMYKFLIIGPIPMVTIILINLYFYKNFNNNKKL